MISVVGKFLYRNAETCLAGRQVVDDGGDDLLECFQGLADSDEGWSGPMLETSDVFRIHW